MDSSVALTPIAATTWLKGHCYCGDVEFEVNSETIPTYSFYCHCESCRRAHASPIYQAIFVDPNAFRVVKGEALIKEYSRGDRFPIRAFCGQCGSRVLNKVPAEPEVGIGFFPSLLEEHVQHDLPIAFHPTKHYLSHEAVLSLDEFCDGLPRM
jgi:hypothetical protein